ncbi:MAG: hypothetical protein LBR07_00120, partial [Puniceicoccales bacterium]|nr:hypothetical protein [Puniceicoccales bacterium]
MADSKINLMVNAFTGKATEEFGKLRGAIASVGNISDDTRAKFETLGLRSVSLAAGIQVFSAALSGAGAILGKFNSTMAQGERLGQLSAITGESVSSLVELRHALSAAGLSGDSVSTIFARFAKAIDYARCGRVLGAKRLARGRGDGGDGAVLRDYAEKMRGRRECAERRGVAIRGNLPER